MIYFSIKFVRGACRAPRLCARNYGKYIAVSDVGIADTKSIRDIGSLRKGGSRWQPQQPQSELLFGGSWWLEFVGNANRTRNGRAQLAALGCLFGFNRYIKVLLPNSATKTAAGYTLARSERVIICKSNALNFLPRFARLFINISRGSGEKSCRHGSTKNSEYRPQAGRGAAQCGGSPASDLS